MAPSCLRQAAALSPRDFGVSCPAVVIFKAWLRQQSEGNPGTNQVFIFYSRNKMVLELHIWGPGFSLPSIDAQCLATIAYFSLAVPKDSWVLVASSDPTVSPTRTFNSAFPPSLD